MTHIKPGSKLFQVECSWNSNYVPRYYFAIVAKITPTGKIRLEDGRLLRASLDGWKLFTEEDRITYNKHRLRGSIINLLYNVANVSNSRTAEIPLEQLEKLGDTLFDLDIPASTIREYTKDNVTPAKLAYDRAKYQVKLDREL